VNRRGDEEQTAARLRSPPLMDGKGKRKGGRTHLLFRGKSVQTTGRKRESRKQKRKRLPRGGGALRALSESWSVAKRGKKQSKTRGNCTSNPG